jgi:hypothetical protein
MKKSSLMVSLFLVCALVLTACGDGGGGGGGNSKPVANAGRDQNVKTGSVVTLDGSASSDPDRDLLTYSWSFTSRPPGSAAALSDPTAAKPTFTADLDGDYLVELIVNDGLADSAPDTVKITAAPNSVPVANAGPDQNVKTGSVVTLDGSLSSDADGDLLTYSWAFTAVPGGSGVTNADLSDPTAAKPTFTPDVDGDYVLNLIVNDGFADSAPDTVTITAAPNSVPVANAGPDQNVHTGIPVTLDGSASSDADGDPLTYSWAFTSVPGGSGVTNADISNPTTVNPTFTPDVDGDYVLNLIVNDGFADSAPDTVTITAGTYPSTPILDDFNRADGALGASWTAVLGGFTIVDNHAEASVSSVDLWTASQFGADQEAYFTVTSKPTINDTSSLGVVLRFDAVNTNGYLVTMVPELGDDHIVVWRVTGGVATPLDTILQEYQAGDKIWVKVVGDEISVYLDQGSGYNLLGTFTDSTYNQAGYIGIYAAGAAAGGALDDFGGGEIVP